VRRGTAALLVRACLIACGVIASDCNTRTPVLDQPTSITAPSNLPIPLAPLAPRPEVTSIEVLPFAGMGGISGQGTVLLDGPSPEGGMTVSLQSQNPAVLTVLPSEATIPQGASTASFSFTTRAVPSDANVTITASTPGRSRTATVDLWSIQPTFFAYTPGRPGLVPATTAVRAVPPSVSFAAICQNSSVSVQLDSRNANFASRSVAFAAAFGSPLRVGVYEVDGSSSRRPYIRVTPLGCIETGRFEVREASFRANGQVDNLWVTFEAGCAGSSGTIVGDLRITGVPRWNLIDYGCIGGR
jgi:hypothetical protein